MSASTALGMVSASLRNLLIAEMQLAPAVNVTLLSPDEAGAPRRVNLCLYKIQENPSLRNLDWQVRPSDPSQLVPPPLALNLYFLMTAYAQNDPQTGNTTSQEILGEAMRVFYEHPVVPNANLVAGLQDAGEQIRIMHNTVDLDVLSEVWGTFSQPYRLSVLYEVSVVQLDPLARRGIPPRVRQIGVPQLEAPFSPPRVTDIAPINGPAGTTVTVTGQHLAGWQAYVRVMGRQIVTAQALTANQFQFDLPNDLPVGFHELRFDISHLSRTTLFFEVTP